MRIPLRDRRRLHKIGRALGESDPQLTAMLKTFARLAENEPMPGHERIPGRDSQSVDYLMKPRHVDH